MGDFDDAMARILWNINEVDSCTGYCCPTINTCELDTDINEMAAAHTELEAQVQVLAKELADRTGRCPVEYECWDGCRRRRGETSCTREDHSTCWLAWSAEKASEKDE